MAVSNKVANIDPSTGVLTIKNKTLFKIDDEGYLVAMGKLAHRFTIGNDGYLKKKKGVRK